MAEDYLSLQLVRLKPAEEWINKLGGLAFVFPKGGAGKYLCGPLNQRLAPGDVLVLDAAISGRLCGPDRGEMVFACFCVCLEHLFPLFASHELGLLQGVIDTFKRAKLYPASSPLAVECHRLLGEAPSKFNLEHRGQLLRVAAAILALELQVVHNQRVGFIRPEDHMIQVFEKLSSADLVSLSVPELADRFGCSRRHLNRLFHQHLGVSVAALRMEMRLLKALALLRNPDAKVINVAEECGFNHLGLFNTCFKRRFGTSPGHWRQKPVQKQDRPAGLGGADPNCSLQRNGLCPWSGQPEHRDAVPQPPTQIQTAAPAKSPGPAHALSSLTEVTLRAGQPTPSQGISTRELMANR
ncbi:MAG: helix-turn-helix transcriptional regulator [Verrucomicrobia bacterium]|nr:helix-turn-helix transcriptional regulator [Verrucomicrobiota bacterium]